MDDEAGIVGRGESLIGPADAADEDSTDEDAAAEEDAADLNQADAESGRPGGTRAPRRVRWMGAAGGRAGVMPIPTCLKIAILVALILVELPIYFISFQRFHPRDDAMSIALTALLAYPMALVMVMAPHLAGKRFRRRHERPGERFVSYGIVATIMLPWLASAVLLGWFRQAVPLAWAVDPKTGDNAGGLAGLDTSWETMSVVFAVVVLLSGLIACWLGVAEDHPAIVVYRAAVRDRQEKEEAYLHAVADQAQTIESAIVPLDEQLEAHWQAAEERERAIWEEHQAAQCDYLDAVALGMGQPTLTEATAAAIRKEAPPDPPLVRLTRARGTADPATA